MREVGRLVIGGSYLFLKSQTEIEFEQRYPRLVIKYLDALVLEGHHHMLHTLKVKHHNGLNQELKGWDFQLLGIGSALFLKLFEKV